MEIYENGEPRDAPWLAGRGIGIVPPDDLAEGEAHFRVRALLFGNRYVGAVRSVLYRVKALLLGKQSVTGRHLVFNDLCDTPPVGEGALSYPLPNAVVFDDIGIFVSGEHKSERITGPLGANALVYWYLTGQAGAAPEPPPPNGGYDVRVFDRNGTELFGADADNLLAYHGIGVAPPPNLAQGDHYYAVVALREKANSSSFIFRASDINGNPIVNPDETLNHDKAHRAWWWPTVCEVNDIQTPYPTDRHTCADIGGFNIYGEGGSGMGAYHDPNTEGPYQAWVRHPTIKSDLVTGIGMIGATNHDHVDAEWQETICGEDTPPPDEPPTEEGMYLETNRQWQPGPANGITLDVVVPDGEDLYDIYGDLRCGTWQIDDPVPPVSGDQYHFDTTYYESETRTYIAWLFDMGQGNKRMSEDIACTWQAGVKGKYIVRLEWEGGNGEEPPDDPEPPPEPPPDGDYRSLLDIANDLEDALGALLPAVENWQSDVAAIQDLLVELKGHIYG